VPSRRALLDGALRVALAAAAGRPLRHARAAATPRFTSDPFTLGVASGSPRADSVVLWTRLAPEPAAPDGGLAAGAVALQWELAEDDRFERLVRRGEAIAGAERAHAVHVEVDGLEPARWYWYRFLVGAAGARIASPTGRTRTAPAASATPAMLRLAFASCQHYERGYFAAWRHLVADDPELVLFLGDYIYESNLQRNPVRRHWNDEPKSLADYRLRHAQYRGDPDLRNAHAAAPWLVTWDDHEVDNDYANDRDEDLDPRFLERRAAAYRAYFEHMPLRAAAAPRAHEMQLFERSAYGGLADIHMLDCRQYRSYQACQREGRGGSDMVENCAELAGPERTMLGHAQERWLSAGLKASRARWNLIAQSTLFSRFDAKAGPGERYWTDGWSGYPAAADRLVSDIRENRVRNALLVGGDVHTNYVCDVKADFADPGSATVATEFCGTSITSPSMPQSRIDAVLPENPHVVFADSTRRGYVLLTLEQDRCTAELRTIEDARDPATTVATRARFVVEDGRPGARRA
jgi:alkaline phosphatase D